MRDLSIAAVASDLYEERRYPDADEERVAVESVEHVALSVDLAGVDLVEQRHHDCVVLSSTPSSKIRDQNRDLDDKTSRLRHWHLGLETHTKTDAVVWRPRLNEREFRDLGAEVTTLYMLPSIQ